MKTNNGYDLIGDIHGHYDKLITLLKLLGYRPNNGTFRHPEGRKVIFLGDFIDRGPKIRETLLLVRGMVDAGDALAIAGNHELNAVFYATPDGNGDYLRPHNEKNVRQHAATLAAFAGREDEWAEWLEWMKRLPFFLDLGELRAVHAAWDAERIAFLAGKSLTDDEFLRAAATKGTPEFRAVENVLKGPELHLPEGVTFTDKEGIERHNIRARWWGITEGMPFGEIVMPEPMAELTRPLELRHVHALPNYLLDAPPVFFGHCWLPATKTKAPLARNIVSLDYSGALGDNPLVAYRWDGEAVPTAEKFITVTPKVGSPRPMKTRVPAKMRGKPMDAHAVVHRLRAADGLLDLGAAELALRELRPLEMKADGSEVHATSLRVEAVGMLEGPAIAGPIALKAVEEHRANSMTWRKAIVEALNLGKYHRVLELVSGYLASDAFAGYDIWHNYAAALTQLHRYDDALAAIVTSLETHNDPVWCLLDAHLVPMWHHFADGKFSIKSVKAILQPEVAGLVKAARTERGMRPLCWHTAHLHLPEEVVRHMHRDRYWEFHLSAGAPPSVRKRFLTWLDNRRHRMARVLERAIRHARLVVLETDGHAVEPDSSEAAHPGFNHEEKCWAVPLYGTSTGSPEAVMSMGCEQKVADECSPQAGAYDLDRFVGRYWFATMPCAALHRVSIAGEPVRPDPLPSDSCVSHLAASTEEVKKALLEGMAVTLIDGPFNTRDDAHYSLDLYWESDWSD